MEFKLIVFALAIWVSYLFRQTSSQVGHDWFRWVGVILLVCKFGQDRINLALRERKVEQARATVLGSGKMKIAMPISTYLPTVGGSGGGFAQYCKAAR